MIALHDLDALLGQRSDLTRPDPELALLRSQMRAQVFGLGSPLDDLGAVARSSIRGVRFRSNVTPPATWNPGAPSAPSPSSGSLADLGPLVQPAVDVELASGQTFTVAPYGEPTGDYRLLVGGALLAGGVALGGAFALGYWLGRRRR